jgi:hypothetical protein
MLMVMYMKENGKMIKLMAWGFIHIWMEQDTMECGLMINNKDLVLKNGLMEQNMKVK